MCGLHTTLKLRHQHKDKTLESVRVFVHVCVHVCILGKVPALELDNVNRSRWGNLNAHPLGYSRAGTKWEEVLEHLPARVDASTLASTETRWQREWKREWEREWVSEKQRICVVCVPVCVLYCTSTSLCSFCIFFFFAKLLAFCPSVLRLICCASTWGLSDFKKCLLVIVHTFFYFFKVTFKVRSKWKVKAIEGQYHWIKQNQSKSTDWMERWWTV